MTDGKKLLTLKEAAQAKNVTTRTIRLWVESFKIDYCLNDKNKLAIIDNEKFQSYNRQTTTSKVSVESEVYLKQLEQENMSLREKLSKYEVDALTKDDLHGFSLCQRKTAGDTLYWYAGKMVDGRQIWVYIGKDKGRAKEKIDAWWNKTKF